MIEAVLAERGVSCIGWSEDIAAFDKAMASDAVCIDFTVPDAFRANYKALADMFKAVVVGTTGWYDIKDEVFAYFRAKGTPLIWASNYSIGINVLSAVVEKTASLLAKSGGYTPYIIEKHHCHKLDAPSGTAITLGNTVEEQMGVKPEIASVRAGEIPGIHTVSFEGLNDRLTLEHEAFSRRGLAEGAVQAAVMTEGLKAGDVYEFKDLLLA